MRSPTRTNADRRDEVLTRALAVILFGLAGTLGFIIIAGVLTSLASGRWEGLAAGAVVGLILGVALWMGRLLWTGRPIPVPPWVVGILLAVSLPITAVQFIMMGQWFMVICVLPWAVGMLPAMFYLGPRKHSKSKGFDDFE